MDNLELYDRARNHSESVRPGGYASLADPSRSILATDNLDIKLDL
jgi:hypothetical protein